MANVMLDILGGVSLVCQSPDVLAFKVPVVTSDNKF